MTIVITMYCLSVEKQYLNKATHSGRIQTPNDTRNGARYCFEAACSRCVHTVSIDLYNIVPFVFFSVLAASDCN